MVGMQVGARRSPHVTYRPDEIDVRLDDVKGLGPVRDEVDRTLDLHGMNLTQAYDALDSALERSVGSGDRVLLLSDGVWGEIEPGRLTAMLRDETDGERLIDRLIEMSLEAGAPDNATAMLIERGR